MDESVDNLEAPLQARRVLVRLALLNIAEDE
jgi:hypothetical protein